MATLKLALAAFCICLVTILSGQRKLIGSVRGTVIPTDGGIRAWIISSQDTVKADILKGTFMILNVKPGNHRLIIEARPPYKNFVREAVIVTDGASTDVGEIRLSQ